ncbi:molybdopterin-dependent oxidoreductase [Chloroflexota bacterium]
MINKGNEKVKADTVCLRCHQKCHLTADVIDGKIVGIADASPINRTPPCREACPIGMDIRGYVILVAQGKYKEAMEVIRDTNPLPLVCGRICTHPCEIECNRGYVDQPIAIQWIKRFVADLDLKYGNKPTSASVTQKEEVAIIGSGPAGLTAAYNLVKAGYKVIVYEATSAAGGMLVTTISEFKLPKAMVEADIEFIKGLGVEIKTSTPVGKSITLDKIIQSYDAVLLATGSQKPLTLNIPGADLDGIYYGLTLLQEVKQGKNIHLSGKVIVVGGGNTAMDVARTALRLGASEVHVTCLETRAAMPAYAWEIERAEQEGVIIHSALAPQRFRSLDNEKVASVDFKSVASTQVDGHGIITWRLDDGPGSESSIDADVVVIAIGQMTDILQLQGDTQIKVTPSGTITVNPETLATDIPGLFAAGDVVVGAGTVVESIAAGHRAAGSIIRYLGGPEPKKPVPEDVFELKQEIMSEFIVERTRPEMPSLPPTKAICDFQEVDLGYSEKVAIEEAKRCINCIAACTKGTAIPDVMYHPDRLLHPLKRVGGRGEGKWERISWDEALGTIASKLKEIKDKNGPEAIHISCGSGQKHIGYEATAIAKKLWPTPNTHRGRYTCVIPDVMANGVTFGDLVTYEQAPDYGHAKCFLFWGAEPDVGTPAQARVIHRAMREGARVIVIDPRPIPMASKADIWLKIRPGTDAALALAMINVIINKVLYDKEFVNKWCSGFDKLREHVQQYTPEWAAKITSLSTEDIIRTARMYATVKPGSLYVRLGAGAQQITSTQTCRAISILVAICGNVDVPGGNLLYNRTFSEALFWHVYFVPGVKAPAEIDAKMIGAKEYPLMHKRGYCDVPGVIRAMEDGGIRALWCVANNLIASEMDSRRIWELMKHKLEFIFVSDFFMTPTAELADIVLPAAFYQEVDTLIGAFMYPSNYITASSKIVSPPDECMDDREVAIEIARRMGVDVSPWASVEAYHDWRLKYLGITFEELCQRPGSRITFPRRFKRYESSTPSFSTASGKVELYSQVFEALGLDPLPVYQEPPESPVSTPELFQDFPLIYTHYRLRSYMHSEGRQIKRQRQEIPYPYLEINSNTASRLGISDGDWVYLETPQSAGDWHLQYKARLVPEMHPDVVAGPHGWWFPEQPSPEHGCFDSNINAVLTLDPPYDPVVGNVQCRAILCRVEKVDSK